MIVGVAEVLVKSVSTGFEADLKQQVGAAIDKTQAATKGVAVGVDGKALEKDLAAAETRYRGFFSRLFSAKPATIPVAIDGEKAEKAAAGIVTQLRQVTGAVGGLPGAEKVEVITAGLLRMEAGAKTSALALAGLAPIILAVVGAAVLLKGASDFTSLTAQIRGVQRVLGGTAQEASTVVAVSKILGLETNTVSLSLFRFSNNLELNKDKLAAYGVEVVKNSKGNADTFATLGKLADAYKATQDPIEKTRLLQIAFGRGGKEMAVLLAGGNDRLKELQEEARKAGLILGGDSLEKGRQFGLAMHTAGEAVKGLSVQLGGPVIGLLTDTANAITTVVTAVDKIHPGLASPLIEFGIAAVVLSKAVDVLTVRLGLAAAEAVVLAEAQTADAVTAGAATVAETALGDAIGLAAAKSLGFGGIAAGTAGKIGLLARASELAAAVIGIKLGEAASKTGPMEALRGKVTDLEAGFAKLEKRIPLVGGWLAKNDEHLVASKRRHDEHTAAVGADADALKRLSDAEEEAANKQASAAASLPDALTAVDKARAASADTTVNTRKAEEDLAGAQQRVADLQVSFAEQATAAKEAYAEKVTSVNRQVADSEVRLAEVIRSTTQKIADDERSLAKDRIDSAKAVSDAQAAANKANLDAHTSLRDAERALSDERSRQNAGGNQALLRQLQNAGSINSATEAVARARAKEDETRKAGADSVSKAQTDGLTKVQEAEERLARDRTEAARSVADAERSVADARVEQNKVAREGLDLGKLTTAQERQMRDAVDAVTKAQKDLNAARTKDAAENAEHLRAEATARANLLIAQKEATGETLTQIDKNKILGDVISDMVRSLGPDSPEAQGLLATRLIVSGLASDFGDAALKIASLKTELAGLLDDLNTGTGSESRARDIHRIEDLKALLGRAGGGPVWPGSFIVGEEGPERLDIFRGGGGFVTPLSGNAPRTPTPVGSDGASHGPLIGQLVVQGATVAASYATGIETARAVRAAEYARSGR